MSGLHPQILIHQVWGPAQDTEVIFQASDDTDAGNKWSQFEKLSQLRNWAVTQKEVAQLVQKYRKNNQTTSL